MFAKSKLLSRVVIACVFCVCPVMADTFVEEDGILIMEAESSGAQGGWGLESSIGGFSGNGYLRWNGSDSFNVSTAGRGTTTYRFRIQRAGNYELVWRSRITRGNSSTEHNDSWARFPTGRNISGEHGLNGWTKVYMNTLNRWDWRSATVDNVGRRLRQFYAAGDHTIQISGRSNGHAIDRIALFDYSDSRISPSRFDSLPQSRTTDNSRPSPAPQPIPAPIPEPTPAPEPAPAPEPLPVPAPEPIATPAPVATEPPLVAVAGNVLSWPSVDAIAINVHRGTGEWVESLPGSQTEWQAPAAGMFYMVATGEGTWESWGRSATVTVESSSVNTDSVVSPLQLTAQVYSTSALELFWVSAGSNDLSYEVRRDDQLLTITDGRSYFDDAVSAGQRYNYSITATSAAGDAVTTEEVSVSTVGNTGGDDQPQPNGGLSLNGQIYSQSAIELFWNTNQLDASVAYRFEVMLNGELLETTDGRSFFAENLTPGTSYEFFVTALDSNGSAVLTESAAVTTFPADIQ